MRWQMKRQIAAGHSHRAGQFDDFMKCVYPYCSRRQAPVAVPEL